MSNVKGVFLHSPTATLVNNENPLCIYCAKNAPWLSVNGGDDDEDDDIDSDVQALF